MKKYIVAVLFTLAGLGTFAQEATTTEKKEITLKDAILGGRSLFAADNLSQLNWIPDTEYYSHVSDNKLVKTKAKGGKAITIITLNNLADKAGIELKRFPRVSWINENSFYFGAKGKLYSYNVKSKTAKEILSFDEETQSIDFNSTTSLLAFTKNNNLYIRKGNENIAITQDGKEGLVYGEAVHRYEFGISKGTFWSPSGDKLAFYRKDETMVTDYPLVNYSARTAELNAIKYPMAGMKSHHVSLGVYDVAVKSIIYLKVDGPKEQYLTNLAWSPDGKYIYLAIINRDQNHVKMNKYNAQTGEFVEMVFEEITDKYIQPLHPITFIDGGFLWQSAISGLNRFRFYPTVGDVKQINTNDVIVNEFLHYNKSTDRLLFKGNYKDEIEDQLFTISVKSNKSPLRQLTPSGSDHSRLAVSSNGKYTIDRYSNLDLANSIDVVTNSTGKRRNLLTSKNPFEDYNVAQTELIELKVKDGAKLFGRMIKPHDFDPSKKYPVLQYVYNGPGVQLIRNNWLASASLWMHYFANKGYIVFTVDGRGSSHRGLDFEQTTFRKLGQIEMQDQVDAANYLKSLPYVDGDRMAIHGWSYGGFMTVSLMLNYPDVFNVGVAGGPVIDWSLYEVMYTERYMDTPETNKEGFELTSTLNKVDQLDGKLMLIHGADDDVVVMQHSMQFLKACIDKEKQVDFFVYPGHKHNVRGKDRVHLMEKVLNYVEDNIEKK